MLRPDPHFDDQSIYEIDVFNSKLTQTIVERDNVWNQLNQTIAERDNLSNQLNQTIAEKDNFSNQLNQTQSVLNGIYSSDFWRVASLYYRARDRSIVLRSIYLLLKWLKRKIKYRNSFGYISKFRSHAKKFGVKSAVKKNLLRIIGKDHSQVVIPDTEAKDILTGMSQDKIPSDALIGNKYNIFFFPMINFSFRYQRPQQLASYFAKMGHRVFYMNITQFLPSDFEADFKIKEIKENVFEVFLKSPRSLDIYGGELKTETIDALYSSLNMLRKQWGLLTVVSLVHNPFWSPLVFKMQGEHHWKIIYDCIDEWNDFSGIGKYFLEQEAQLVKKADLLTVTAELLYEKWIKDNNTCSIVKNACDYDHFVKASLSSLLSDIRRPIIGFFGGIAEWIDMDMLHYAATHRKDWSFVFLGGIFTDVSKIEKLPNVHLFGNKPYEDMPNYLRSFDVCLIPFKKNKITEAVDPVKLYEYFSLGKPVVARDLSEIRHYKDYLYLFNTQEEFVECIEKALHEQDTKIREERRKVAASNTWNERINLIHGKIKGLYPKASIIVTTFNNLEYNTLCIESILLKTDHPNYEIIITDNNSTDGTQDYLIAIEKKFHHIKIILNGENEGFAKATNKGIRVSKGDYIVLLNNDTVVTKGWLTKFINYLEKYPDIGLIGPITNFCGNEAKITVPYQDLSGIDSFAYHYTNAHSGEFFNIKMLALFCTAMRREIIEKVGLLDESFGIGMFEDDDYSLRVKIKGYRVVCAEDIFIHHFGQVAFKKLIENGEYENIFERNQKLFEKKWGVKWEAHKHRSPKVSSTGNEDITKTKEHWGKEAGTWKMGRGIYWLEHERIQQRINEKVSGNPSKNPYEYLIEFMSARGYKFPLERCLTLGCGDGELERGLSKYNFCVRHDAFDIADKAIERAVAAAMKMNLSHIHYEVLDINEMQLSPDTYDVVFGVGSLHHFAKLENIFYEVNKALKPDGLFFVNEYIGPSRFQWTERQLDVINAVLRMLPKKYKVLVNNPSVTKKAEIRPTIEMVKKVDPSEAIRSEEILPLLKKHFEIIEEKHCGGAILHTLLTNIAGNFKSDNEDDMKLLKAVCDFEDILMKWDYISSDYVVVIAKK